MINRPLYKALSMEKVAHSSGNAGLWYDKYCDQWAEKKAENNLLAHWSLETNKIGWIHQVAQEKIGDERGLKEFCDRQRLVLQALRVPDEEISLFSTQWRFVTGLGREHPVENGFAWHQTLGVPYLPGSSIKGMVRAWVEQWKEAVDEPEIDRVFGPRNSKNISAGSIIFFDALPVEPVRLEADIMTPHYAPYYQDGECPGDWHDPTPIPFLTVAPGQTFQFGIAPRNPKLETSRQDASKARQWLKEALQWIGAGAKTAVGYGKMFRDTPKETKRLDRLEQEQQERETKERAAVLGSLPAELRKVEQLRELFHSDKWKLTDNARNEMYQMRTSLMKEAPKWKNDQYRMAAAKLLNQIFDASGWGKGKKLLERKNILEQLGFSSQEADRNI